MSDEIYVESDEIRHSSQFNKLLQQRLHEQQDIMNQRNSDDVHKSLEQQRSPRDRVNNNQWKHKNLTQGFKNGIKKTHDLAEKREQQMIEMMKRKKIVRE